jgi:hypothetical protein
MPDEAGALTRIVYKLKCFGAPSLSTILARLMEMDSYEDFIKIIGEFLPDYREAILHESTPASQIAVFANRFSDRYFPLDDYFLSGDVEGYEELVRGVPVICQGMGFDEYHNIPEYYHLGNILMTYLVVYPWEVGEEAAGARAALADALAREGVPEDILKLVPKDGFKIELLEDLLKDTKYGGVSHWANYISQNTGNPFLDIDYETYGSCEFPEWDRAEIEGLTTLWQQSERMQHQVTEMAEWLEKDPLKNFKELVDFIKKGSDT